MPDYPIKKALIAVDGSQRSIDTVRYLAGLAGMSNCEVNLFHVNHQTNAGYDGMARQSLGTAGVNTLKIWEKQQWVKTEGYLKRCREILLNADFDPKKVRTTVQRCRQGIARDIAQEAGKGYDVLFLRRRGMSSLPALVMGSVALKLFNTVSNVPLIFAGRQKINNRILIGVDNPSEALRTADFVGKMARYNNDLEVGLIFVLRRDLWISDAFSESSIFSPSELIADIHALFTIVKKRLSEWGIAPQKIESQIIKNSHSRAGTIVDSAEKGDFCTIVIGRSRVSRVNTFLIGRVSNKIMQIGPKQHFWIVN